MKSRRRGTAPATESQWIKSRPCGTFRFHKPFEQWPVRVVGCEFCFWGMKYYPVIYSGIISEAMKDPGSRNLNQSGFHGSCQGFVAVAPFFVFFWGYSLDLSPLPGPRMFSSLAGLLGIASLQWDFFSLKIADDTLPETNIAPENRPSQKESSIPTIHFQVRAVSFREGMEFFLRNFPSEINIELDKMDSGKCQSKCRVSKGMESPSSIGCNLQLLDGGFKHFLFSPLLGKMIQFD